MQRVAGLLIHLARASQSSRSLELGTLHLVNGEHLHVMAWNKFDGGRKVESWNVRKGDGLLKINQ